jgi:hypothetical protein
VKLWFHTESLCIKLRELSAEELIKIKDANEFISSEEIGNSSECSYLAVIDEKENKIYAIFDLRNSLRFLKQMRVFMLKR